MNLLGQCDWIREWINKKRPVRHELMGLVLNRELNPNSIVSPASDSRLLMLCCNWDEAGRRWDNT